jgi:WD40 repeat protein
LLAASTEPASVSRWLQTHHWVKVISVTSLVLLVVCALPVWTFVLWSFWVGTSHEPPPVLARLDPGGQGAGAAQWSPDGRYLAEQVTLGGATVGEPDGTAVVLWDVAARREVRRFTGADGGLALAWSPDGSWLATTDGARTLLWRAQEIEAGDDVRPAARLDAPDKNEPVTGLAWAKDGQTLAMVDEGGLGIWQSVDGSDWKQTQYFLDGPCATLSCGRSVLWSPDGRWLLAAPWHGKNGASGVGVWDTQDWSEQPLLNASAPLAWSPDGGLVVVRASDETTLSALRAGSWTVAWRLNPNLSVPQGYNVYPQAAGWSPDGRWLVGSADGWVDLWRTDTRKSAWVWNEQARSQGVYVATGLAWSPDAYTLAVTTDGTARLTLYDLRDPSPPLL